MERAIVLDEQRTRRNEQRRARYRKERDLLEEHGPKRFRSNALILRRQTNTLLAFSVNGRGRDAEGALLEARLPGTPEVQSGS